MNCYYFREKTCPHTFETPHKGIQSQNEEKCLKRDKRKILLATETAENPKLFSTPVNLSCSKSANMFHKKQVLFPENIIFGEKDKASTKVVSTTSLNDKTPTMTFCTPKQYKSRAVLSNTKINMMPLSRTPIKRYFSDNVLSQATPDCFSIVQVETPSARSIK